MIAPGAWVGVLGGGQLGRMFAAAAQNHGYHVAILDPDPNCPASAFADEHVLAEYDDEAAWRRLAARCVAVTTEFENVPAEALRYLGSQCFVAPRAEHVAAFQDRGEEAAANPSDQDPEDRCRGPAESQAQRPAAAPCWVKRPVCRTRVR